MDRIGIVVASDGDLFVTETGQNGGGMIFEIDPSADTIAPYAGTGNGGYSGDGGPAILADFSNNPGQLAMDAAGDLFVTDTDNNVIREINASGVITTVAGDGTPGYTGDNGPATSAELKTPTGVAVYGSDLYISDSGNNVIREVNLTTGVITTFAGDGLFGYSGDGGPATAAELNHPADLAVDAAGNLYIADTANQMIREVNPATGVITTVAGSGNDGIAATAGLATSADLAYPTGIAVDGAGDLFIGDSELGDRIREVVGDRLADGDGDAGPDHHDPPGLGRRGPLRAGRGLHG